MMTNYFGIIFVAIVLIMSCILYKTSRTFRYYLKYTIITLHIGIFTAFLIPIFTFRPRNVKNLRLVIIFLENRTFYLEYIWLSVNFHFIVEQIHQTVYINCNKIFNKGSIPKIKTKIKIRKIFIELFICRVIIQKVCIVWSRIKSMME